MPDIATVVVGAVFWEHNEHKNIEATIPLSVCKLVKILPSSKSVIG